MDIGSGRTVALGSLGQRLSTVVVDDGLDVMVVHGWSP
jgi:hypothetical protein